MKVIDARQIKIREDRQREQLDSTHILNLAMGMSSSVGQLNPVVLEKDGDSFYLIAGECRTKAAIQAGDMELALNFEGKELGLFEIAYTLREDLDDLLRQEIELAENRDRLDLTWRDRDRAITTIAALKEAKEGRPVSNKEVAQEIMDMTGKETDIYHKAGVVEKAKQREEFSFLDAVAKAKTAAEADRAIDKHLQDEKRKRLAEKFDIKESPHTIIHGDCCEEIKKIPDGTFDVVLADPIYGIDMHKQNAFQREKIQEGKRHDYDDSWENFDRMFSVMPEELYRVCRMDAALYIFCDINRFFTGYVRGEKGQPKKLVGLSERFAKAGWTVWPRPLVWYKGNIGGLPVPDKGPRYTAEYVLFARKGDKKTTGVYHDVINIPQTTGHEHPAGKPPAVYHDLLRRSANPGDRVLDFAMGGGPIFAAANKIGCTVTGMELDQKYIGLAKSRVEEEL